MNLNTKLYCQVRYETKTDSSLVASAIWIAYSQIGITNVKNPNRVKSYLESVGVRYYNPFCASGIYWSFKQAVDIYNTYFIFWEKWINPLKRTGLANGQYNHIKRKGRKTAYSPKVGDFIVWKKKESNFGHIEIVYKIHLGGWVTTIAFNVDKRKVKIKKRNIYSHHGSKLIRGLVGFYYD